MFPRSQRVIVTLAATAALAGGAVAHAATSSSSNAATPSTTTVAGDPNMAAQSKSDCPNMGNDSAPSTTPSSDSSTSTTGV